MSGNHFLKTDIILASGNSFSSKQKPFSSIPSDIFQEVLHPGQWKHIFQSRKKSTVFSQNFFPASGNHYLNYREAYLKLLSLLLATIFFDFSDISANVSSFFVQQKRILKQILHSCQWKPIFCLLETVLFYLDIFFLLVEIQYLKNNLIPASGN